MVEHSNLSHYVSACRELVKIGPNSRVLQLASFSFDACVLEWAVTLNFGATLCFVDHLSLVVGDYLADVVEWNQVCLPPWLHVLFLILRDHRLIFFISPRRFCLLFLTKGGCRLSYSSQSGANLLLLAYLTDGGVRSSCSMRTDRRRPRMSKFSHWERCKLIQVVLL